MSKRKIFRGIFFFGSLLFGAAIFAFLIYSEGPLEVLEHVGNFGIIPLIGFICISIINFVFYSIRWRLIINRHLHSTLHVKLWDIFWHRLTGFAVSYLTPAAQVGGEPARIAMLTTSGVPLRQATSSVVLDVAFELTAYAVFIVAGVLFALVEGFGDGNTILIIFSALAALLGFLVLFFATIAQRKGFFIHIFRFFGLHKIKRLARFEDSVKDTEKMMGDFLNGNTKLLFAVVLISFLVLSFRVIEVLYIAYFFGIGVNFGEAFLLATLPGVALLLPIPAGLGVFEGSFTAVFAALAIPVNAIAFALIIRVRDILFITAGSIHMMRQGRKFVEEKIVKKSSKYAK
ncbi:flippase-like domain-containing protein [Patescibacteria group bacterium]|nr:flippase-like domain-containing protein [Patescibacteria group bacterium]